MIPLVTQLNFFLALGAIVMQVGVVMLIGLYAYEHITKRITVVGRFAARTALPVSFVVALCAMGLTLVYSEIFGFAPCGLCWLQRVFMFPQVFILAAALWMRDRFFAPLYVLILSAMGAVIALYNHYIQMGGSELITCPVAAGDCGQRILFEFGYMTFPLLAFTLFAFLAVLMLFVRRIETPSGV